MGTTLCPPLIAIWDLGRLPFESAKYASRGPQLAEWTFSPFIPGYIRRSNSRAIITSRTWQWNYLIFYKITTSCFLARLSNDPFLASRISLSLPSLTFSLFFLSLAFFYSLSPILFLLLSRSSCFFGRLPWAHSPLLFHDDETTGECPFLSPLPRWERPDNDEPALAKLARWGCDHWRGSVDGG